MKSTLLNIALSAAALVAMGCSQSLKGNMTVYQNMSVIDEDGDLQNLQPGTYEVKTKLKSDDRVLKIDMDGDIGLEDIEIRVPNDVALNADSVDVHLLAAEINQPWDLNIVKDTQVEMSAPRTSTEQCYTPSYGYYGRPYCGPYYWDNYYGPRRFYHDCYFDYTGTRRVEFQDRLELTSFDAELVDPVTSVTLATLNVSKDSRTDRVYTYRGICN